MFNLDTIRKTYIHFLETLEEMALATVARIVPWLIPVGPAFMIKTSVETYLHVSPIIAILMALGFEGMGVFTSHVAFLCWTWNKGRNKTDNVAPFNLMRWLVSAYLAIGIVLVVLIKVYPPSTVIAPAFFLPLGLVVYTAWAVHIELSAWRNAKDEETHDRKIRTGLKAEIKELAQKLRELSTQFDTKQKELDTLTVQIEERQITLNDTIAQIEAQKDELLKVQNELTVAQNKVSNGVKSPITGTPIDTANNGKQSKIELRREKVLNLLNQGMSQDEISNELRVSLSTIKRDVKSLNGRVTE